MAETGGADFLNFVDEVQSEVGGYDKGFETPYIDRIIKKREGEDVAFRLYVPTGGKPYHMIRLHREPYRELSEGEKAPAMVFCNGSDDYCRRAKEFKAIGEMDKAAKLAPDRQFWFSAVLTDEPGIPRILRATQGNARKILLLTARAGGYAGSDEVDWQAMSETFKAGLIKGFGLVYGNEGRDVTIKYKGRKVGPKKMFSVDLRPKEDSPALDVDPSKFKDLAVASVESFEPREERD